MIYLICIICWLVPFAFLLWFMPIVNKHSGEFLDFQFTFWLGIIPILNIVVIILAAILLLISLFEKTNFKKMLEDGFNKRSGK